MNAVYEWAPIDTVVTYNVTTSDAVGFTAPTSVARADIAAKTLTE